MIKVLAIDDNRVNLTEINVLLTDAFPELELFLADNGQKGIEIAISQLPDIVLLDLIMPEMDGYEVCRFFKSHPTLKLIPLVVLVSNNLDEISKLKALNAGADALITKPLDESELKAQIKAIIRIKEAELINKSEAERLSILVKERTLTLEKELEEKTKIEDNLQQTLQKLETSKIASLNLLEDLKSEIENRKKTEDALRENEYKLSEAQRIAKLGSWNWNKETNTTNWSSEMYKLLKWDKSREIPDLLNPVGLFTNESLKRIQQKNTELLASGLSYNDDFELIRADGRHIWVSCHVEPVYKDITEISGIQGTFLDITSRKLIEQSLEKSEKRYRTLFENMLNGFAYCKMIYEDNKAVDFIYLLVNKSFEKITGLHGITGKNATEVIPGLFTDNPELFEICGRVARTSVPEWFETYLPALDLWFSISVYSPAREYFIAIYNSITDQKKSEIALRKSETKYRQLFEGMVDGFALHEIILDEDETPIDYRFIEVNQAFCELTGLIAENIIGKTVLEVLPNTENYWIEKYGKVALNGEAIRYENYSVEINKYFEVVAYCPEKYLFATIIKNISKQKELYEEEKIRSSINEIFARLSGDDLYEEILSFAISITGAETGTFGYFNEKGSFIIPKSEKLGNQKNNRLTITDLKIEKDDFPDSWNSVLRDGKTQTETLITSERMEGQYLTFETIVTPLLYKNQIVSLIHLTNKSGGFTPWDKQNIELIAAYIAPMLQVRLERDRLESKRAEAEIELQKLSRAVEFSPASVVITDPNGDIVYTNPKFTELTGYSSDEVLGKNPRILKSGLTPEQEYIDLWNTITKGGAWRGEFHNKKKNNELYWEEVSISPIFSEDGRITNYIAVKEDITDKKENQNRITALKEFYEKILESIHDGIYVTDKNDFIYYVNTRMTTIAGIPKSILEGKHVFTDFPEETLEFFKPYYLQAKKRMQAVFYDGVVIINALGLQTYQSGIIVPLIYNGKFDGVLCTVQDVTQKKLAEIEINRSKEELRKLTDHIQVVREEEKKTIARDIHDDLGQKLAALKMDLFWMTSRLKFEEPIQEKIKGMHIIINESVDSIHRIIRDLRPPVLDDLGLYEAIEWLVNEVTKRSEISIDYINKSSEPELNSDVQLAVFRVIQEGLTNIVRHSAANKASVYINENNTYLMIKIQDNGIGIQEHLMDNTDSFGLNGMKERIMAFKGNFKIISKPAKGCTIEFNIPKV